MKRISLVFVMLLAMLGFWVSAAFAYQTYLPIVNKQATPTPTVTSTPTTTPSPTPTSIPYGVQILPNDFYYVDSIDYLNVVGEVLNNTRDNLRFVEITANFFNASGQLLDTDFTYTYLENLPAWDKTCFDISVPVPSGWLFYQFEAPTYWTDGQTLPNLVVLNDSGSYDPTSGGYDIIGQISNDEAFRVTYVSPVGTLYNNFDQVVGCDFTYVNNPNLYPGQISSFDMTFFGRDYADVTSYRLQVDGTLP
jgi:hypothetical protein